ncbi:MAG: hypothetical protein ACRBFS_00025 [Aureispira sp.]
MKYTSFSKGIPFLFLLCLPITLVAQHGSGGAGMGAGIALAITVFAIGGIASLLIVLINIIAFFKPKKLLNTIGIGLSTVLLLVALFVVFTAITSGEIDLFLFCCLSSFVLILSILHLRKSNRQLAPVLKNTSEELLDDNLTL